MQHYYCWEWFEFKFTILVGNLIFTYQWKSCVERDGINSIYTNTIIFFNFFIPPNLGGTQWNRAV